MPAKISKRRPTCDRTNLEERKEAHRKLSKRLRQLGDSEDPTTQYNELCILTPTRAGSSSGAEISAMAAHERKGIYHILYRCFKNFATNVTEGQLHTFYQYFKSDQPQPTSYCSIVFLGSDRRMFAAGATHLDIHCFLHKDKSLAVILMPCVESSFQSPIVHRYVEENGLMQEFNTCANCGKTGPFVWLCQCSKAAYCQKDCQRSHWGEHKAVCRQDSQQEPQEPLDLTHLSDLSSMLSSIKVDVCVVCGASDSLKACKCKTMYCGSACQNSDWPAHKAICKRLCKNLCPRCKKVMGSAGAAGALCSKCALG